MAERIYVTGHKSPDTDSICSSYALAKLKELQGIDAVPVRAGELNKETTFALEYFKVTPQPLVTDFYIKVGEAVHRDVEPLALSASLKDAARWFSDHEGHDFAPVVNDGKFAGILERDALAEEFIRTVTGNELDLVKDIVHDAETVFSTSDNGHDVPAEGRYVVVDGTEYIGVICAACVAAAPKKKVFLVDHNEKKQIIDGIDEAEIVGVVDHHRIGGTLETDAPIFIYFRPVGCSATMVTALYEEAGISIPQNMAGLLLSAIISDTVLFRSPTCTAEDKAVAEKLAAVAGVDIKAYGMEMLKAGANVSDLSPDEIVRNDMKEFNGNGQTFTVAQVQVMDTTDLLDQKQTLLNALEKLRTDNDYLASFLMITSIIDEATNLIFAGNMDGVVGKAFAKDVLGNEVYLPGVMSRKKQVIPQILSSL